VVIGIGLAGDWLVRNQSSAAELITGLVLLICALPGHDNLTVGELAVVALGYVSRSRWTQVSFVPRAHGTRVTRARPGSGAGIFHCCTADDSISPGTTLCAPTTGGVR